MSDRELNEGSLPSVPALKRSIYARLLDKLSQDGAALVVFDFVFEDETPEDERLARAVTNFGRVIFAGDIEAKQTKEFRTVSVREPAAVFRSLPGFRYGLVGLDPDRFSDRVVRVFPPEVRTLRSLAAEAAEALGHKVPRHEADDPRYIGFYAGANLFNSDPLEFAIRRPAKFFRDKVVFIGGKPKIDYLGATSDMYSVPFRPSSGSRMPGVEIHATMLLNLLNGDHLTRLGEANEAGLIIAMAVAANLILARSKPRRSLPWVVAGTLVFCALAILLFWSSRLWFDWLVVASEVPLSWAALAIISPRPDQTPAADQYEFLERVGEGAFGEVWLARNTPTGALRAIKRVYRDRFPEEQPYEREFEGLKNFELSGLVHPGWVRILHVSKDDTAGCFYYAMDPADDLVSGPAIVPGNYTPKTLGRVLVEEAWLPVAQCVSLGMHIADALGALHKLGMVHRDVKPSNIIFVRGHPKLADIGLIAHADACLTTGGTRGFAPDTGLGTPAADLCCLGRTLYQAATGCPPDKYPSLPPAVQKRRDAHDLMRLMNVIIRACEISSHERYQSAEELRDDLMRLQIG